MSSSFFLNTLSASGQFATSADAGKALRSLLDCLEFLRPGVAVGVISLLYDVNMERRGLIRGSQSLAACLASLDADLRKRWYLSLRRARVVRSDFDAYSLTGAGDAVEGEASQEMIGAQVLVSFGGRLATEAERVRLDNNSSGANVECSSFYDMDTMQRHVLRYAHNPKHRVHAYQSNGETISAMTVSDAHAQIALTAAVSDDMGHLYGIHDSKLLKFVLTGDFGGQVFHAYEVSEEEVPTPLLNLLIDR